MKKILGVLTCVVFYSLSAKGAEDFSDVLKALDPSNQAALGLCSNLKVERTISYKGTAKAGLSSFDIFHVKCDNGAVYIFRSARICDVVKDQFSSKEELLEFFYIRFKGIANDLIYGIERCDVKQQKEWPTDQREIALMPLVYNGLAKAIQKAKERQD